METPSEAIGRFTARLHDFYREVAGVETADQQAPQEHVKALQPSTRRQELLRIYGSLRQAATDIDMVLRGWNSEADDPQLIELHGRYRWIGDLLPAAFSFELEEQLRIINYRFRDSYLEPVGEMIRRIENFATWTGIVRDTVEAAVEPLRRPAEIGKRQQEQAGRMRRKHSIETYLNTVTGLRENDSSASWNIIQRRAALRLQVATRTIRQNIPRKPW